MVARELETSRARTPSREDPGPPQRPDALVPYMAAGNRAVARLLGRRPARLARQLEVNGRAYTRVTWDEYRQDAKSAEQLVKSDATPPPDLIDDERVRRLREDRDLWRFKDWDELRAVLSGWEMGQDIPEQLRSKFSRTADPHPDAFIDLDKLLPASGEINAVVRSLAEFEKSLLNLTKSDPMSAEAVALRFTDSCGMFAGTLIDAIGHAQKKALKPIFQKLHSGQYDARALEDATLAISHGKPQLLHFIFPDAHEFVVEKAPGGGAYLYEAWVSAFNGLWWSGLEGTVPRLQPEKDVADEHLRTRRDEWGKGKDCNLTSLAFNLGDLLRADVYGDPAAMIAWKRLPFRSAAIDGLHTTDRQRREKTIALELRIYEVDHAAAVADALGGKPGVPLGMVVLEWLGPQVEQALKAAAAEWEKIKSSRGTGSGAMGGIGFSLNAMMAQRANLKKVVQTAVAKGPDDDKSS